MDFNDFEKRLIAEAPLVPPLQDKERQNLLRRIELEDLKISQSIFNWKFITLGLSGSALAIALIFFTLPQRTIENNSDSEDIYSLLIEGDLDSELSEDASEYALFLDSSDESLLYE